VDAAASLLSVAAASFVASALLSEAAPFVAPPLSAALFEPPHAAMLMVITATNATDKTFFNFIEFSSF
jgi:hypothetical protein